MTTKHIKVRDLAKELDYKVADLLKLLADEGIEISKASDNVDEDIAELIRDHVAEEVKAKKSQQKRWQKGRWAGSPSSPAYCGQRSG